MISPMDSRAHFAACERLATPSPLSSSAKGAKRQDEGYSKQFTSTAADRKTRAERKTLG